METPKRPKFLTRPPWKKKDIIRNITDGRPMLVLHVWLDICTVVADLTSRSQLGSPLIIYPRSYDQWATEKDFEVKRKGWTDEETTLEYDPVNL